MKLGRTTISEKGFLLALNLLISVQFHLSSEDGRMFLAVCCVSCSVLQAVRVLQAGTRFGTSRTVRDQESLELHLNSLLSSSSFLVESRACACAILWGLKFCALPCLYLIGRKEKRPGVQRK